MRAQEIVKSAADTFDEMTKIPPESTLGKLMELHTVLTATAAKMGVVVGQSEGGLGMYYLTHLRNSERNAHPDIGITEHAGLPQPPPERLAALHKYAPLVTYAYEETELALRAQLVPLGYDLVFFESEPSTERPAHYLCFHDGLARRLRHQERRVCDDRRPDRRGACLSLESLNYFLIWTHISTRVYSLPFRCLSGREGRTLIRE